MYTPFDLLQKELQKDTGTNLNIYDKVSSTIYILERIILTKNNIIDRRDRISLQQRTNIINEF